MTLLLSLVTTGKSLATFSLYLHFRCILMKFPQDLLSLGQAASAFCHRRSAPDPPSFSWSFPGMSPVCPHLSWAQGWLQSVRHCIARAKKKNHLPQSAGSTLMHPRIPFVFFATRTHYGFMFKSMSARTPRSFSGRLLSSHILAYERIYGFAIDQGNCLMEENPSFQVVKTFN